MLAQLGFPNFSKGLKRLQVSQTRSPFCLQINKRLKIRGKEFLHCNWLNFHDE